MKSILLAVLFSMATALATAQCPIKPLKPLKPLGCPEMHAVCVCDANGHCWWEWVCSPPDDEHFAETLSYRASFTVPLRREIPGY
ncbi:MAG: hypothetical protein ACYCRE_05240 [Acidobacteriaceae bacterium]